MEVLRHSAQDRTPYLLFDGDKGELVMRGRCIPEDAKDFFKDLHNLMQEYEKNPQKILEATFDLEYFNTATAKELMSLLYRFKKFPSHVTWCHEMKDRDMIDVGKDFEEILQTVPFTFQEVER